MDLRHEAAHHELPSLQMLRIGARQAMAWLNVSYWSGQEHMLWKSRDRLRDLIIDIIDSCRCERYNV